LCFNRLPLLVGVATLKSAGMYVLPAFIGGKPGFVHVLVTVLWGPGTLTTTVIVALAEELDPLIVRLKWEPTAVLKRVILVTTTGVIVRILDEVMVNVRLSVAVTVRVVVASQVEAPDACVTFLNGACVGVIPRRITMSLR